LTRAATEDWSWFEDACVPQRQLLHALTLRLPAEPRALSVGLQALRWLADQQKSPTGHPARSAPTASTAATASAQFDQQPVDALATVSACIEAYHATEGSTGSGRSGSRSWFLRQRPDSTYDAKSGGCRDGLQEDRVNQNQGRVDPLFLLAPGR
jgi:hypothetical protein